MNSVGNTSHYKLLLIINFTEEREIDLVKGTGVDIIEISRIEQAVIRFSKFSSRVFTPREIECCMGNKTRWASLAARFAAKEAVAKALGTGIGKVRWTDIEIFNDCSGKPGIRLFSEAKLAAARLGITNLDLSISHCREYAVAFVVAY